MANQNENQTEIKVAVGIRLEADIHAAVEQVKNEDDRPSTANTVERLLRTHPRVKKIIEAETAGVGA